jgi:hypothetical protein
MAIKARLWYVPRESDAIDVPDKEWAVAEGIARRHIARYQFEESPVSPRERTFCRVHVETSDNRSGSGRPSEVLSTDLQHRHRLGAYSGHAMGFSLECPSCLSGGSPED